MDAPIINKVSESGLITLDLEIFYPAENIVAFDLAPFLFRGLILKKRNSGMLCRSMIGINTTKRW